MANTHGILAVVAAILAAITALVVFDFLLIVPAGFALIAGILIALQSKDSPLVMASGVLGAIIGLLVVVGIVMGWLSAIVGTALVILANIEIVGSTLKTQWHNLPKGAAIGVAVALVVGALLSLIFASSLAFTGEPALSASVTTIVVLCCLSGLYPAITAMKA